MLSANLTEGQSSVLLEVLRHQHVNEEYDRAISKTTDDTIGESQSYRVLREGR